MSKAQRTRAIGVTLGAGLTLLLCLSGGVQSQQPPGRPEEAGKSAPGPSTLARFTALDFQAFANHKRKDSFHSGAMPGNTLESLSSGEHRLLRIPFQIGEGVMQLGSTQLKDRPAKIEGIKVNKKVGDLHFLHATAYHLEDEVKIGSYTVRYEDGSLETIPIVNAKDLTDWWKYPFSKAPTIGKVAWEGTNEGAQGYQATLWLFLTTWKNPKPNTLVTSIDFSSTMDTICAPFCVAITVAEPLKARPSPKPLTAADLDRLWTQLASDGPSASDAVEALAGAPAQAIPFLRPRIQAAGPTADTKTIATLISKLDDESFTERETASRELQKLGLEVLPQLRRAAAEIQSAEVRQRAQELLEKLKKANLTSDQRRLQAVLNVFELIGSDEARKVLQDVVSGKAGAWLAAEAEETLKRMKR
jgi:hypothetical protein